MSQRLPAVAEESTPEVTGPVESVFSFLRRYFSKENFVEFSKTVQRSPMNGYYAVVFSIMAITAFAGCFKKEATRDVPVSSVGIRRSADAVLVEINTPYGVKSYKLDAKKFHVDALTAEEYELRQAAMDAARRRAVAEAYSSLEGVVRAQANEAERRAAEAAVSAKIKFEEQLQAAKAAAAREVAKAEEPTKEPEKPATKPQAQPADQPKATNASWYTFWRK